MTITAQLRAEAATILRICPRVPSRIPFELVAHICAQCMMAGATRAFMFTILYDKANDKTLLHIGTANTFFSLNTERTLGDLLGHFFRGKEQAILAGPPAEILIIPLEALKTRALGLITVQLS